MRSHFALAVLVAVVPACGGGSSTPTPPVTAPQARDGFLELNGSIGGRFVFSSSPLHFRDGTSFGCGDAEVTIPYRETRGGAAVGGDYELKILEPAGFARRATGKADNLRFAANETGVIRITERFVCVDYTAALPPRAEIAINFGGTVSGSVSQIRGVGPLTLVE